jgi:hypothetical protein
MPAAKYIETFGDTPASAAALEHTIGNHLTMVGPGSFRPAASPKKK